MTPAVVEPPASPPPVTAGPSGPADAPDLYCPGCGYHLRGIEGIGRCPECGLAIDRSGIARSRIPWVHRRHIGRVRAYWRTVWLATLRPRDLATEVAGRVDYPDAQRFRVVTAFLAAVPLMAALVAGMVAAGNAGMFAVTAPSSIPGWAMYGKPTPAFDLLIPWESGMTFYPTSPLAVLLLWVFITGVHTYWFHPRRLPVVRQNRAVALAYYGGAPIALSPVLVSLGVVIAFMYAAELNDPSKATWAVVRIVEIALVLCTFAVVVLLWRTIMTLLSRTTQPGLGRLLLAGALVPVQWIVCAALALVVFPWVVGYVRLVISSLR